MSGQICTCSGVCHGLAGLSPHYFCKQTGQAGQAYMPQPSPAELELTRLRAALAAAEERAAKGEGLADSVECVLMDLSRALEVREDYARALTESSAATLRAAVRRLREPG